MQSSSSSSTCAYFVNFLCSLPLADSLLQSLAKVCTHTHIHTTNVTLSVADVAAAASYVVDNVVVIKNFRSNRLSSERCQMQQSHLWTQMCVCVCVCAAATHK